MSSLLSKYRFIIAAGGTGGHLFPAIAVAEKIGEHLKESDFLFVGTKSKLESKVVPKLGYKFKSIWISGFARKITLNNILFPVKLFIALIQSMIICIRYKPHVVIGAGAYVSGPIAWAANILGAKIVLLEQNSFPGITNRMLEKKADKIFISYEESKKYFRDQEKLSLKGNPIRVNFELIEKKEAKEKLGFKRDSKCVFILGGSLGALKINEAVEKNLEKFKENNISVIWQCGKRYYGEYKKYENDSVKVMDFIEDMNLVYSAADLVVSRAGATSIAEIASLGLASIFVPSPNVAADHQNKNADVLVNANAAEKISDSDISSELFDKANSLLNNDDLLEQYKTNIKQFSSANAAEDIAVEILRLAQIR